jgi:hypothetical protein
VNSSPKRARLLFLSPKSCNFLPLQETTFGKESDNLKRHDSNAETTKNMKEGLRQFVKQEEVKEGITQQIEDNIN